MSLGKKMVEGSLDDLLTVRGHLQIQVEDLKPEALTELRDLIQRHGGRNLMLSRPKLSLEELFLKTVEYERSAHQQTGAKPTNEV